MINPDHEKKFEATAFLAELHGMRCIVLQFDSGANTVLVRSEGKDLEIGKAYRAIAHGELFELKEIEIADAMREGGQKETFFITPDDYEFWAEYLGKKAPIVYS
jgi:hypothetical protein